MIALRRQLRLDDGASAVEFALVLPVLVLFLFGIIEFGLAFGRAQGMEAAAREGARLAAIGRDVSFSEVQAAARGAVPPFMDSTHIDVTINGGSTEDWCGAAGEPVTVDVEVRETQRGNYALNIPLWAGAGSAPSYAAAGTFRCEAAHE